jgi:putative ABC transport system permease protein
MLSTTTRIAWRNLGRSRRRTAIALAAIAIAQFAVLTMDGILNGRAEWTLDTVTGPLVGDAQVHAPGWREDQAPDLVIDDLDARLAAVRGTEGVSEAYARLYAPALAARDVDGHAVVIVGVEPEIESASGGMLDGVALAALPTEHTVLVGAALARDAGISVGDELAVLGQRYDGSLANDLLTVGGILDTPIDLVSRTGIVMALPAAQETFGMPDMAHEITIRGAGTGDVSAALAARVAARPELEGLEVLPWREIAPELAGAIESGRAVGLVMALVVFIAAAAGVMNTMLMATFERRRELGMLLALGTTPGRLVRMILTEAVALGVIGVLIGSAIGSLFVLYLGGTGVPILMGSEEGANIAAFGVRFGGSLFPYLLPADYVPGIVGVTVVSVLAALWPAALTARLEPMEAMRS